MGRSSVQLIYYIPTTNVIRGKYKNQISTFSSAVLPNKLKSTYYDTALQQAKINYIKT